MKRFMIFIIIVGFTLTGALLFFNNTSDTFKVKEKSAPTRTEMTEEKLSINDMTDSELMRHLTDYRSEYNTYGDFIEESMRMIEFSMEQLMIWATVSNNSTDTNEKAINTMKFHIKEARELKEVPPLAGEIQSTYLKALDEFEQASDLLESNIGEPVDLSLLSSRYNTGIDYVNETKSKMDELESFAYNLMVAKEFGTSINTNEELQEEMSSNQEEEIDKPSPSKSNDLTGILSYFPLEVGYNYNFSYAMDGVGEAIKIIGKYDNKFLAYGNQGGMVAFYRVYEIRNNEVFIAFNATEGGEIYNFIDEHVASNDFSFLENFKTDPNYQGIPFLTWPLEEGKTFGSAQVLRVGEKIQIDGNEYKSIVIRYFDEGNSDKDYTDYYFAEGYGIIRCVFMSSNSSETPMVVDYAEF